MRFSQSLHDGNTVTPVHAFPNSCSRPLTRREAFTARFNPYTQRLTTRDKNRKRTHGQLSEDFL